MTCSKTLPVRRQALGATNKRADSLSLLQFLGDLSGNDHTITVLDCPACYPQPDGSFDGLDHPVIQTSTSDSFLHPRRLDHFGGRGIR